MGGTCSSNKKKGMVVPPANTVHVTQALERSPDKPLLDLIVTSRVYNSLIGVYPNIENIESVPLNSIVYGLYDIVYGLDEDRVFKLPMGFPGAGDIANEPFIAGGRVSTLGEVALLTGDMALCQHLLATGWEPWLEIEYREYHWVPLRRAVQLAHDGRSMGASWRIQKIELLQSLFGDHPLGGPMLIQISVELAAKN
jgi:hypothetical protein